MAFLYTEVMHDWLLVHATAAHDWPEGHVAAVGQLVAAEVEGGQHMAVLARMPKSNKAWENITWKFFSNSL